MPGSSDPFAERGLREFRSRSAVKTPMTGRRPNLSMWIVQISRTWCRAAFAIGLVVVAAAVADVPAAQGAYPGRNGVLAVVSSAPGSGVLGGRIDLIRLDGTRVGRVPCDRRCRDLWPVWSPTGRRLAFDTAIDLGPGGMRVAIVRADGSRRRVLPSPAPSVDAVAPAWSPDSARIAYSAGGPPEIWTMNSDGSGRERLTPGSMPAWSPDGRWIAFERRGRIYVMDAAGRDVCRIPYAPRTRTGRRLRLSLPDWQPALGRTPRSERGRVGSGNRDE